jgi:hypothetical protein
MIATIVEGEALLETVIASVVAGIGVTVVFSVAILGVSRFIDYSQAERPRAAGAAAAVATLGLLATLAVVVVGMLVMTSK